MPCVVRAGSTDRVVAAQPWASWFEWAAAGVPVMVDSRVEVVPPSAWADYLAIISGGPATLATLARIGATLVVVDPHGQPALDATMRAAGSGWRLAFEDRDGALFAPDRP